MITIKDKTDHKYKISCERQYIVKLLDRKSMPLSTTLFNSLIISEVHTS